MALGGKSLITVLYTDGSAVHETCQIFQISADISDLGRTYATPLSCVGDIKTSLQALILYLEPALSSKKSVYKEHFDVAKKRRILVDQEIEASLPPHCNTDLIAPITAAREIARAIKNVVSIVDEAISTSALIRKFISGKTAENYLFMRGGALGWGMPASVGYSLGLKREPVVCLVGDGAAMYSPQALWTAVHEKLPITFVVINNREYNILKNFMKSKSDYNSSKSRKFIAMDIVNPPINYVDLATSMGVPARTIVRAQDIAAAVECGISSGKTNLIEIITAP